MITTVAKPRVHVVILGCTIGNEARFPNVITTVAKPRVHVVILGCTIPAV